MKALVAVSSLLLALVFPGLALSDTPAQLIGKDFGQNRELLASAMRGHSYVIEVDRHGKIVQVLDTGTDSDIAEAQHLMDNRPAPVLAPVSQAWPTTSFQGQAAIDYLGRDLPEIATAYGLTPDKLEELFLNDDTVRIDRDNRIFYAGTAE